MATHRRQGAVVLPSVGLISYIGSIKAALLLQALSTKSSHEEAEGRGQVNRLCVLRLILVALDLANAVKIGRFRYLVERQDAGTVLLFPLYPRFLASQKKIDVGSPKPTTAKMKKRNHDISKI